MCYISRYGETIPMARTIAVSIIGLSLIFGTLPAMASQPAGTDLTPLFHDAGASVERLQVYEIAGIVIIRGRVAAESDAAQLGRHAKALGYERVANLVQIVRHDDQAIARAAEMELARHRALDGCRFTVESHRGVIRVAGWVRHELQKDVALQVLRSINGVQSVESQLEKF
jgi:osmotically-inducible protein OsmY